MKSVKAAIEKCGLSECLEPADDDRLYVKKAFYLTEEQAIELGRAMQPDALSFDFGFMPKFFDGGYTLEFTLEFNA